MPLVRLPLGLVSPSVLEPQAGCVTHSPLSSVQNTAYCEWREFQGLDD